MNTAKMRRPLMIMVGILIVAAIIAYIKRDTIAGLVGRGGDTTLKDDAARNSPQAKVAMDFLIALRAMDKEAIAGLATAERVPVIQREMQQPSADFQQMRTLIFSDLPADPAALRSRIKAVQTRGKLGVVWFETKANSWFVQVALADGAWKVSSF